MPEATDFEAADSQYMEMPSGRRFYMSNPTFDIADIAYTLAGQPRFNGTARRNEKDHTINVAEHSVRASYMILEYEWHGAFPDDRTAAMTALMHDATEAILGDVPGPWKILLPDFVKLEDYLWRSICDWVLEQYGIDMPREHVAVMKLVDWRCLFLEAREVMTSQGRDWVRYENRPTFGDAPIYWWSPCEAEDQFLRRFYEIAG